MPSSVFKSMQHLHPFSQKKKQTKKQVHILYVHLFSALKFVPKLGHLGPYIMKHSELAVQNSE